MKHSATRTRVPKESLTPESTYQSNRMALVNQSEIRDVHGITDEEKSRIRDFLQGAVYCWCKNRPDEWFSLRDLMGGENYYWQGTPLITLYEKHEDAVDAVQRAGRDGGWLLKRVIDNNSRKFKTKKEELIRKYSWIQDV